MVSDASRGFVLSLDGVNDYVDCGNRSVLDFGTKDWTLSAWIQTTQADAGIENGGTVLAKGGDSTDGIRYALVIGDNGQGGIMALTVDDNIRKVQAASLAAVNDDKWHHIAGMRRGNYLHLYVDGSLQMTMPLPQRFDLSGTSQHNMYVGAVMNHLTNRLMKYFKGRIDEVCVYKRALSDTEVRALACTEARPTNFEGCGTIVTRIFSGVAVLLFQAETGQLYELGNQPALNVGDRVWVQGQVDPACGNSYGVTCLTVTSIQPCLPDCGSCGADFCQYEAPSQGFSPSNIQAGQSLNVTLGWANCGTASIPPGCAYVTMHRRIPPSPRQITCCSRKRSIPRPRRVNSSADSSPSPSPAACLLDSTTSGGSLIPTIKSANPMKTTMPATSKEQD